ncbi:MAG: hypothetical protein GY870_10005, partial [archaeon]|nr:hypothetical protein [archaeon]
MSRRIDLLRLDYLFSVLTPCLIAIFIHDLNIIDHLDILIGFSFFAITGNTLNDIFDMRDPNEIDTLKRTEGYPPKHIFGISVTAFTFGCMMFMRTVQEHPENGLFLVL